MACADDDRDEFSVWVFFPDYHYADCRWIAAGTAVARARDLTRTLAVRFCEKIIITDGGDHTVFEWRPGEGVVFPSPTDRE